jgi:hypothetical protein
MGFFQSFTSNRGEGSSATDFVTDVTDVIDIAYSANPTYSKSAFNSTIS